MSRRRWVCPQCGVGALGPERPRRNATVRFCLDCSASSATLVERTCPSLDRRREAKLNAQKLAQERRRARREAAKAKAKAEALAAEEAHRDALSRSSAMDFGVARDLARAWVEGDADAAEPLLVALARADVLHGAWVRFGAPLRHSTDDGETWWRVETYASGSYLMAPGAYGPALPAAGDRLQLFTGGGTELVGYLCKLGLRDLLPGSAPSPVGVL